ncbi:hypothetical protein IFT80_21230 [Pseudomonas sp. CFBP 8771]|uniref:hypothetical protein n=1 Tax=Pseudomonas sp. CFBP 8771 TaxID=2775285 RepID=UPI001782DCD9|nr:hypothetical protein [Pseudomonas sp. CFBP 8771]MBD8605164.1 hypothetical protein [Pseudomonas sp. CFBP 8771]
MPDLFDFEAILTPAPGAEPAHVVVFFVGPDMITDAHITEALQKRLSDYVLPDHVAFLVPDCHNRLIRELCADSASPMAIALERRAEKGAPSYGFAFFNQHGEISKYVNVAGDHKDVGNLITSGSDNIVQAGMRKLVKCTSVLTKAPAGFLFSKPSSRASNYFIRAENLLTETLHSHFLAFACLEIIQNASNDTLGAPNTIYLDTMAFLPVALSIQLFQAKFGNQTIHNIKSFHSHDGLKDGSLPDAPNSLCLISASTNCGLAAEWVRVNRVQPCRVATFLSFLSASDSCKVLHTINKPEDFESMAESEPTEGRRLIRIHGERFVAQHTETRILNISMGHLPDGLQTRFHSFMGQGLFTCFSQIPNRERHRTVQVNKDKLVNTTDFVKWFNQMLMEESPASTSLIIHDDDRASEKMAQDALTFLKARGLNCDVVSARDFEPKNKFDGSVIIVAAAAERGTVLLGISRRLRSAQNTGTRIYLVGALLGRSYQLMKELSDNLTQPPKGSRKYVFKAFLDIPAASLACNSHWRLEQELLNSLTAFDESGTSNQVKTRVAAFDEAASTGLSDHAFWPSSYHPGQMMLTKGFAFVSNLKDVTVAACTDIFLTILWILQNARENAKIDDSKRLESGELQQVLLSPEVFSRYDDGIIQGAFLRAALPTELDYSTHETHSTSMADIILRVVQGHGFERGDASMEFVTALAIGKIRLHKEVDERLRIGLKNALHGKVDNIRFLLGEDVAPI